MTAAIVLLARAPSAPGKTRLTAGLPAAAAVALRAALLLDTFDAIRSAGAPITVGYTPPDARGEMEALFGTAVARLVPQRGDDLGSRMHDALRGAFDRGADHAVLVGSDVPTLPAAHVADAFALLETGRDVALGPSEDGGYYLIGTTRAACSRTLFSGIEWGTGGVLSATLDAVALAGLSAALVRPWYDVDRPVDLARVADDRQASARHTREWLATYHT